MSDRNFRKMLEAQWARDNFVCVGLDSDLDKIPASSRVADDHYGSVFKGQTITAFNRAIVEATCDLVCAYKPNVAFYRRYGNEGMGALQRTIADIHRLAPDVPVILDAKYGDIGETNEGYAEEAFGLLRADATTVHPYLGGESLAPFLARAEKGIIVLCRTSNPGAREFQDLLVDGKPFYQRVARNVVGEWNKNGNCAVVVGATYPIELREVREIVGDMPILIPGVGAQGGDVQMTVQAGKDSRRKGMIINSSRGIIFAFNSEDFAQAARRETMKLRDLINQYR
ncbi:orotidine-5'-phosphate decarboxylase [Patescibacteria group bacterium]|nr:MAG: orotidine-5'-phosphate decarboxylase [Patescibacteria group bacterium]